MLNIISGPTLNSIIDEWPHATLHGLELSFFNLLPLLQLLLMLMVLRRLTSGQLDIPISHG